MRALGIGATIMIAALLGACGGGFKQDSQWDKLRSQQTLTLPENFTLQGEASTAQPVPAPSGVSNPMMLQGHLYY